MSVSVSMPQLGESVTEGTVTRWLKREGEHVEADEPLLEVSTDKVDTEIPSPVSGTLRGITVAEDETVAVGAELAVIDEDGAAAAPEAAGGTRGGQPSESQQSGSQQSGSQQSGSQQSGSQQGGGGPEAGYQQPAASQPAPGYQQPAAAPEAAGGSQGRAAQVYPPPGYDDYQDSGAGGYRQPGPAYPETTAPPAYPPPGYAGPAQPGYGQQAPYGEQAPYEQQPPYGQQQEQQQAPYGQQTAYEAQAPFGQGPGAAAEAPAAYYGEPAQQGAPGAAPPAGDQEVEAPDRAGPSGQQDGQPADGAPRPAAQDGAGRPDAGVADGADGPYVTPLVRKLAAEHGVDLAAVSGTGVGGRIRKQDVLDAAGARRDAGPGYAEGQAYSAGPGGAAGPDSAAGAAYSAGPGGTAGAGGAGAPAGPHGPEAAGQLAGHAAAAGPGQPTGQSPPAGRGAATDGGAAQQPRPAIEPSRLRGTTMRLSRARQVIAQRMVESLQTSAQLTTVIEADVTAIARLRDRYKTAFEQREGVKLSFLPFFALAAVEALKVHPELNAVIDTAAGTVTYHDAEHLGVAVDTDRGLMVPVIRNAGDLNIGGLARKIADLAARTRAGQVSPDELSGGTFTLTNTGSRGALFDTPILNQPQVGILGTGTVDRRAVVLREPTLGEVITVRSIVHLALTYDHRLVDGADAARYLVTVKTRLEEGSFEAELGG